MVDKSTHAQKVERTGYEEEEKWIDLATVQGYRRIVMCQGIRDEVQLQLEGMASDSGPDTDQGGQQWKEVLLAMCSRRLLPTEWLNKVQLCSLNMSKIPCRIWSKCFFLQILL